VAALRANNELQRLADVLNSRISQLEVEVSAERLHCDDLGAGCPHLEPRRPGTNVGASGRIFWDQANGRWAFSVRNLPQLPPTWFMNSGMSQGRHAGKGGSLHPQSDGSYETNIQLPGGLVILARQR